MLTDPRVTDAVLLLGAFDSLPAAGIALGLCLRPQDVPALLLALRAHGWLRVQRARPSQQVRYAQTDAYALTPSGRAYWRQLEAERQRQFLRQRSPQQRRAA